MNSPLYQLPLIRVALLVAVTVIGMPAAADDRLTEPPVKGDALAPIIDLDDTLKLFEFKPAAAINVLEGGDFPNRIGGAMIIDPVEVAPNVEIAPIGNVQINNVQLFIPQVEEGAFIPRRAIAQRRLLILNARGQVLVTNSPRGRDAWVSSILRTTNIETARNNAEQDLENWLDKLDQAFQLTEEQQQKLRLAGQGDIGRFLLECETLVDEALALEARMSSNEDVNTQPLWERSSELRAQLSRGLHGEGSLFRKQWERTCGNDAIRHMNHIPHGNVIQVDPQVFIDVIDNP